MLFEVRGCGTLAESPGKQAVYCKQLTRHCRTFPVVITLRGADGSCKVFTVVMESCRGQPRLQCGRVAAALLPQVGRFCTGNNAIAKIAHWPSQIPFAEAPVGLDWPERIVDHAYRACPKELPAQSHCEETCRTVECGCCRQNNLKSLLV
ncbi:hypothetical protein IG631_24132 [Alternaria alternata]|nr:hypothetical protein IG631_24132 [Alternaria alternata]